jgi:hypothetical protein
VGVVSRLCWEGRKKEGGEGALSNLLVMREIRKQDMVVPERERGV